MYKHGQNSPTRIIESSWKERERQPDKNWARPCAGKAFAFQIETMDNSRELHWDSKPDALGEAPH